MLVISLLRAFNKQPLNRYKTYYKPTEVKLRIFNRRLSTTHRRNPKKRLARDVREPNRGELLITAAYTVIPQVPVHNFRDFG